MVAGMLFTSPILQHKLMQAVNTMRRVRKHNKSKRALTLVELVVAMTLMTLFAGSCVMLIVPISKIYTRTNELGRAQLLADTVVDALRNECAGTFIKEHGDVYIISSSEGLLDGEQHNIEDYGNILVLRKTKRFYETIATNYGITNISRSAVEAFETSSSYTPRTGNITSRSIYGMFPSGGSGEVAVDAQSGFVHFGFFERPSGSDDLENYDFTNPFGFATYRDYHVRLNFHDMEYNEDDLPAFVICDVTILNSLNTEVYNRTVVLCFASPVVQ